MSETTPDVTIVGAGMSGMTAALKLLQAGFSVKVIEASDGVGGKFGARPIGRNYEDFAWHVFAEWCRNFWDITQTIRLNRLMTSPTARR
jgi:monoamine oxidase